MLNKITYASSELDKTNNDCAELDSRGCTETVLNKHQTPQNQEQNKRTEDNICLLTQNLYLESFIADVMEYSRSPECRCISLNVPIQPRSLSSFPIFHVTNRGNISLEKNGS